MAHEGLQEFLENLQNEFAGDGGESFITCFRLPLVIYTVAGATVIRTRDELAAIADSYRTALTMAAWEGSAIEIVSQESTEDDRLRVTTRSRGPSANGKSLAESVIRYFLIKKRDRYLIEMIEYIESPLPAEEIARLIH